MKRSLITAVLIHIVLISFIWVGFRVPLPKDDVKFYYGGSTVPEEIVTGEQTSINIKSQEGAVFSPWIKMRELNKPKR
jgi:hypothetical protein